MTKYNCEICGFSTINKTDISRHNKTTKHLRKVQQMTKITVTEPDCTSLHNVNKNSNVYTCTFCKNVFTRQSSLSRHQKSCTQLTINTKDQAREIEMLKNQLNTYEKLLHDAMPSHVINNFTYVNNMYPNAPALEGRESYDNLLEAKQSTLMEILALYHEQKRLHSFVGDYIIKYYKKDKAKDQSLWSSDVAILTYIISQACNKKGNIWTYDKKGNHMKKIIIEPALEYIREHCCEFCENKGESTKKTILEQLMAAAKIISMINSGELANDIVRYIAPEFMLKQLENNV